MTTKSSSTAKKPLSTKKVATLPLPIAETLSQPQQPNNAVKHKLATPTGDYGGIQVVTSNRLKRRFCNSGYETSLYIPDTNYTRLSIIGLELGITVDEVIRGLIEAHLAGNDHLSTLKLFAPALQV